MTECQEAIQMGGSAHADGWVSADNDTCQSQCPMDGGSSDAGYWLMYFQWYTDKTQSGMHNWTALAHQLQPHYRHASRGPI